MEGNSSDQTISFWQLVKLQFHQYTERTSNWLVLLLFCCAGIYALYQGYADKRAKITTINAFRQQSDSLLNAMKTGLSADTSTADGKAAYAKSKSLRAGLWNTRLPSYKQPVSTSLYAIGQSDVLTYYYLFAAENFEMQWLKQTETGNPLRALAGHFDVSFWIVYLLPLMVLLLSFNALSAERDNGNWRLIAAQGISEKSWLKSRLMVVAIFAAILMLMILIAGTTINVYVFDQGFALSDGLFFFSAFVYLFFWLSLFYFINCLRRSTAYNAMVGGIAWIGICMVLPVVISNIGAAAIPVDNTEISNFSRRPQQPRLDTDKAFAAGYIKELTAALPAYKNAKADTASGEFYLRVYHAWHLLLHKERWPVVQQYFHKVEQRQQLTDWSILINPAASTDGYLTALADNDAGAFHHFTEETEQLHGSLHRAMFETMFTQSAFSKADYDRLPEFTYSRSRIPFSLTGYFACLLILITGLFKAGGRKLKEVG